jgi:hypothetical protein
VRRIGPRQILLPLPHGPIIAISGGQLHFGILSGTFL